MTDPSYVLLSSVQSKAWHAPGMIYIWVNKWMQSQIIIPPICQVSASKGDCPKLRGFGCVGASMVWANFIQIFQNEKALWDMTFFFYVIFILSLSLSFFFFFFFRAPPPAYGGSHSRGRIGAAAACLPHSHTCGIWGLIRAVAAGQSHSNARSELCLRPTSQLTATPGP